MEKTKINIYIYDIYLCMLLLRNPIYIYRDMYMNIIYAVYAYLHIQSYIHTDTMIYVIV